jgi:hypothetical protein
MMAAELTPEEEGEVASGLLPFTVAGTPRYVPELKRTANRAWKARFPEVFASLIGVPSDTPDGLNAMLDAELALVLAYDETGALGDLEDATEREVDAIYNRLVTVANPLAASPMAVGMAILRAVAESALASSTNGASPTGATAAPRTLTDHLPSAKSSSSTRRRKSA